MSSPVAMSRPCFEFSLVSLGEERATRGGTHSFQPFCNGAGI